MVAVLAPNVSPVDAVVVVTAGVVVAPPNKPVDAVVVVAAGFAPNKPVDAVVVVVAAGVAEFPNENPVVPVTVAGFAAVLLFVPKLNIFDLKYLRNQFSPEVMIIRYESF